jgi:small-conductance mechanosensitive channel
MNQLYPLTRNATVNHSTERYGPRSAKAIQAQQQLTALYTDDASSQYQLDLTKVKERLQQLDSLVHSDHGQTARVSQQALDIAHALVFTFEQLHDASTRDMAILRSSLHSAQERLRRYEAMVEPSTHGEVF